MSRQFNELIKEFNSIRLYAREFYINGFKLREEFREKAYGVTIMNVVALKVIYINTLSLNKIVMVKVSV